MKKIFISFCVCVSLLFVTVYGADFTQMTERLMSYHNLSVTDDLSGISKLQNRRSIKNPALISSAINGGVIVPRKGIIVEDGADFTPLTDGIIKRYINDENYTFVAGTKVDLLRNKNVKLDRKTFFITENGNETDFDYTGIYTCLTDKDNRAVFVWESEEIKEPALYRVTLYWAEGNEMIVSHMEKKVFGMWETCPVDGYEVLDISHTGISKDFVMNNLDKNIYVFADGYGNSIKVKGIAQ